MSGGNPGYTHIHGMTNNARRNVYITTNTTNVLDRGQSKNQIRGKVVCTTLQKPKETLIKSTNFPIQQEKRPLCQQITIQLPKNSTSAQEGTMKTNKQVMEMLRFKQESFQKCIRAILQNNQPNIAINHSGLGQGVKYQLARLKATMIELQKDQKQLQQIKLFIKWVEDRQGWTIVDSTKEWKAILAKSINDRKAIQECVIGNPVQYERINYLEHTDRGMNILKNLTKLSKMRQLELKMRIQFDNITKQKSINAHFTMNNQSNQPIPIQKVYDSIKQHLASSLQEELARQKKKVAELSQQLESSKRTRPSNGTTAIDKHLNLIQELNLERKAKDVLQDSKNEQIRRLKSENTKLQQELKDVASKSGSNSRIQIKDANTRQLQSIVKQKQADSNYYNQVITKLRRKNESLTKDIDNLNQQLKKNVQQNKSVQLGLRLIIEDLQEQIKLRQSYITKFHDERKIIEESTKHAQNNLLQKESLIVKLNGVIAQRDRQNSRLKSNQKQMGQKYELMMKEKSRLEEDLKYQRQRGSAQRKNVDASRQQIIRQRDELQTKFDSLQAQARQVANSYQALQAERNQLKFKLQNLQSSAKNQLSSPQLRQNSTEVTNLQNSLKSKEKQIAELKSLNSRSSNQSLENQIIRLRTQNAQQKQEIKIIDSNLSSKIRQIQQKNRYQIVVEQKLRQAELGIKLSEAKTITFQREKTELSSIISRHERSIKAKDEQIKQLMHTSEALQQMMSETADLKVNTSFTVEEKPQQSSNKAIQLQDKVLRLNKQISQYKDIHRRLEAELKNKEARVQLRDSELSLNIQTVQYQNSQLKSRIRQIQQLSRVNVDGQARIKALYQHQLLNDYYQYKLFLTETLQEHYNRRIKRTRLIFNYDLLNKVNFHQYIDGVSSLLLIIKTASGMFLAGYTQGPFVRRSSDRDGLILSLTNRKYFTLLQQNRRAITYDEYYIIFGNSQIRLKSLENRVFSNFGISNGYYNSRGERVTVLMGGGQHDREMDIESYEIYQVLFDDY